MDHDADGLDDASQGREEMAVNLDGFDGGTRFGQREGERSQSRPDLEHEVTLVHVGQSGNFANRIGINDKVLAQSPRGRESEFFEHRRNGGARVCHQYTAMGTTPLARGANWENCVSDRSTMWLLPGASVSVTRQLIVRPFRRSRMYRRTPCGTKAAAHCPGM